MKTRSIKILQTLLVQQYPVEIEELAKRFRVSDRTIRSDIKEINDFLSKNKLPLIQTIRGNGIKISLSENDKNKLTKLINGVGIDYYSNNKMRILNLILEFAFGDTQHIYEKQKEFQVSKSTLDNDMRVVREILSEYHLILDIQVSKKAEIKGSEKAIRIMLFNIINKFVGIVDIYDTSKMQASMYQILFKFIPLSYFEEIATLYEKFINYDDVMYKNQTILFISIWVNRLKNNYFLAGTITKKHQTEDNIDLFINEIESIYGPLLNAPERSYVRLILETLVSQTVKDTSEWTKGQIITLELIDHVQEDLNLQLKSQEELFSGLFKHIVKLINRLKNNMQINNPLTEEIKHNNPEIFQSIKTFEFKVDNLLTKKITDDEIAFIAIYFLVGISKVRQNYNYLYKAIVFCNHGKATGKLLAQMLEENFDIDVVAVLSPSELSLVNKIDADIAFSTINIELEILPLLVVDSLLIQENYKKVETFLSQNTNYRRKTVNGRSDEHSVNIFFEDTLHLIKKSEGNVTEEVYRELKKIFRENNLHVNEKVALPTMSEILKDNHIAFNLEANNWEEAIKKSASSLLNEKIITEEYIEAMVDAIKVNGPYIVMGPHIALAHAKPEDGVNEIGVSISKLKEPVKFGHEENDPVEIIFCIAPIDSYTHINVMKDIFDLMNNVNKTQKLLNSESATEFKQRLFY